MILESVDAEYIDELKKDYVGYKDETAKSLPKHIKDTWCKITTLKKGKALQKFCDPWDQVSNIATYERMLDKAQMKCDDMGVGATDEEKVQIYVQQMYACDVFTEKEMTDWEAKTDASKTWVAAKAYFGRLYQTRRSYENDMKAHRAGYESTNNLSENTGGGSLTGRTIGGGNSVAGRTTTTTSTRTGLKAPPSNEWEEYTESIEDSLVEAKEYAAAITSRAETKEASLIAELAAQRKQTQLALDQTAELVALMKKHGTGDGKAPRNHRRPDDTREQHKCGNCGLMGVHKDEDCFSLEKNKDKRPAWYKKKNNLE